MWGIHLCGMKYKDSLQAEAMRHHIEACKASGLTVSGYCKEHRLAPSTFYYWQKRLNAATAEPGFTQLFPVPMDMVAVTVHYPNGVRVVFSGRVSSSAIKELVCCI